jgi:eukaryotic-like serine/threonine-protein kinase
MTRSLINTLIGEYRIVDLLGEGGMGEVYRAVHNKIGRVAAVKVLNHTAPSPEFLERFLNEARIQASLQHPNIATLYDFCEFNNQPCIIMEYVEGQTLTDYIRSRGALPLTDGLPLFQAIVDALSYVHERGIIHRDIKSNNVKITPSSQVKLLDFGIAKSGASPALTIAGGFVGTLQYISPEQFMGGIADARSDIWALGVLLYEMVTARMPFDATTIGGLYQKINAGDYSPPSALNAYVPREVEAIIARCLRVNPAERYQSARELLVDTSRLLSQLRSPQPAAPPPAPPPASASYPQMSYRQTAPQQAGVSQPYTSAQTGSAAALAPPSPQASKSKMIVAVGAVVVVLAVVVGGLFTFMGGPTTSPATNNSGPRQGMQSTQLQTFTLEVFEGQAEVYKSGEKVGTTPYRFDARPGEQIDLMLKREGYLDKSVKMNVSENKKVYTIAMERKQ